MMNHIDYECRTLASAGVAVRFIPYSIPWQIPAHYTVGWSGHRYVTEHQTIEAAIIAGRGLMREAQLL